MNQETKENIKYAILAIAIGALALNSFCDVQRTGEISMVTRVDVTRTTTIPPIVKAVITGDIEALDTALEEEEEEINDVICLDFYETNRSRLEEDLYPTPAPVDVLSTARSTWALAISDSPYFCRHETLPNGCAYGYKAEALEDGVVLTDQRFNLVGTPLMLAVRLGNVRIVKELLKRGANPNIVIKTQGIVGLGARGCERPFISALIEAATLCQKRTVMEFYQANAWGDSACHDRVLSGPVKTTACRTQCLKLLRAAGARTLPTDGKGRTAAWDALNVRSEELLEMAVEDGVDIMAEDNFGKTVLDYCRQIAKTAGRKRDRREIEQFAKMVERLIRENGGKIPTDVLQDAEDEDEGEVSERNSAPETNKVSRRPYVASFGLLPTPVSGKAEAQQAEANRKRLALLRAQAEELDAEINKTIEEGGRPSIARQSTLDAIRGQIADLELKLGI